MNNKKGELSIETIIIIVLVLVFLLVALLMLGIFRGESSKLFTQFYNFITGK